MFFVAGAFLEQQSLPLDNLLCWLEPRIGLEALERAISGRAPRCPSLGELIDSVANFEFGRRTRLSGELVERYSVDQDRIRADSRLFLERDDLSRFADFGCEVANHTRSHLFCRSIATEAQGAYELVEHRAHLEEWTGRPVRAFSYPYGSRRDATPLVERLLAQSGHEASFLVESRPNSARHPGRLPTPPLASGSCPNWFPAEVHTMVGAMASIRQSCSAAANWIPPPWGPTNHANTRHAGTLQFDAGTVGPPSRSWPTRPDPRRSGCPLWLLPWSGPKSSGVPRQHVESALPELGDAERAWIPVCAVLVLARGLDPNPDP